jgi:hypothetical protein
MDWLEVTKNQSISSEAPSNYSVAEQPIFTQALSEGMQTTPLGLEIPVPTTARFLGDLKKASRRTMK